MEMEQQNIDPEYAEVFGLEPTEAEAEPAETGTEGTETDTQAAQSAREGAESGGGNETPPDNRNAAGAEMSAEERHAQAAARRAREDQIRRQAEQTRVDQVYAEMFRGQMNPFTGKPILTEADYRAYNAELNRRKETEANNAALEKMGIEPDAFGNLVQAAVRKETEPLQRQLMESRMNAARERAAEVNRRAQEAVTMELKKISALDPAVKTMEDIAKMPTAGKFNEYVQKGLSLTDAFELANREAITARRIEAAKTAARNGVAGKQHLNPVGGSGEGNEPISVPAADRAAYLELFPDATEDDIRREYAKYLKSIK